MSTLTGQQIQNSYQGLLKLANSSTGITSNFQAVEDGLGNDTGIKIASNYLSAPNQPGFLNLKADYYGVGFNTAATAPVANTQNILIAYPFYDNGLYSYSALTYNIATATTSSDSFEIAFYTAQMVEGIGLAPHTQVLSAQTLTVGSTGVKTTTFSSNLSFSGYGAGVYFAVVKISNSGVTPTVRPTGFATFFDYVRGWFQTQLGFQTTVAGTAAGTQMKTISVTQWGVAYSGLSTFNTTFSTGDVATYSTTVNAPSYGWLLNTVK